MIIYEQEKKDGISIDMLCKGSITYASCVEPMESSLTINKKDFKSLASYSDKDLYYTQSILVSSNWNKNDDIFDKAEVWAAKNTPEDKPTNLEHDENTIIGHIVANWPVDENGQIIPEDTAVSSLPDKFHIVTASVIYKAFSDPSLKNRSEELIQQIESGKKYVSMECFFNNFDYGLINQSTGQYKVLNRNENTSYLTKHLRAYGGTGEFENYKIGRVLRSITFSGKGFVDKPANSDSIIFSKNNFLDEKKIDQNKKIGVFDNQACSHSTENDIMAENTTATEQTIDLEKVNSELKQKVEALESQITSQTEEATKACEANVEAVKSELTSEWTAKLESTEAAHAEALLELANNHEKTVATMHEDHQKKMEEEKAEIVATYEKKVADMHEEMKKDKELLATYRQKEEERMMAEMYKKRMASLVSAGLSEEDAAATTKQFESFTDEQFDSIVATLTKVSTQNPESTEEVAADPTAEATESGAEETTEEATDNEDDSSEAADILDEVTVADEVNLGIGGEEESEAQATRAALVDFVYSRLGKK